MYGRVNELSDYRSFHYSSHGVIDIGLKSVWSFGTCTWLG